MSFTGISKRRAQTAGDGERKKTPHKNYPPSTGRPSHHRTNKTPEKS